MMSLQRNETHFYFINEIIVILSRRCVWDFCLQVLSFLFDWSKTCRIHMFFVASLVFMDKYGTHICASSLVILLLLLLLGSKTLPYCNHTQTLVLISQAFYSHCFPGVIPRAILSTHPCVTWTFGCLHLYYLYVFLLQQNISQKQLKGEKGYFGWQFQVI